MMTSRNLRFAVCAALAAVATPALALDQTAYDAVKQSLITQTQTTDAAALSVSGATATDRSLSEALLDATNGICLDAAGAADIAEVYTTESNFNNLPVAGNSRLFQNYSVLCRARSGFTGSSAGAGAIAANAPVAVYKYSGGSGSGIANVADGSTLNTDSTRARRWVNVDACRTAGVFTSQGGGTTGQVQYRLYVNCTELATLVPKVGISDVEPFLLSAVNGVTGGATQAQLNNLSSQVTVGVSFGPVVSRPLFVALQRAQGLDAAGCTLDGAAANATEACLPSLSTSQLRGIFQGRITSTLGLLDDAANTAIQSLPGQTAPASNSLFICRREVSSGTQVSYQTFFLGQGCLKSIGGAVAQRTFVGATNTTQVWTSSSSADQSVRVWAGNGAGEVKKCMDARSAANQWAIGLLSTENPPGDGTDDWRYVKVDGVAPSLENTVRGRYQFFTENYLNNPGGTSPNVVSGLQVSLKDWLRDRLQNPALLAGSNLQLAHGLGGLLAIPTTAADVPLPPITNATVAATPRNSQTRSTSTYGGAGSNCTPPATLTNSIAQ